MEDKYFLTRIIGRLLRTEIAEQKCYVSYMADDINLHRQLVYNKLHGRTKITAEEIYLIADYLGIDPGGLLNKAIEEYKRGD